MVASARLGGPGHVAAYPANPGIPTPPVAEGRGCAEASALEQEPIRQHAGSPSPVRRRPTPRNHEAAGGDGADSGVPGVRAAQLLMGTLQPHTLGAAYRVKRGEVLAA